MTNEKEEGAYWKELDEISESEERCEGGNGLGAKWLK